MKRSKTPTRIQMEAVECGAVALGIVLEYHGHVASVETLRDACGVSRDGVRASMIAKAGRAFGLEVEGLQVDLEELDEVPTPAILHWDFDHFVVLEAVAKDAVYINDPALGPRKLTPAEVDASFTGVVLTLTPGPNFRKTAARPSLFKLAYARLHSVRTALLVSAVASLTMIFPNLLGPTFSGVFTDNVIIKQRQDWLLPLMGTMVAVALMSACMSWMRDQYLLRAQTKLASSGNLNFLWHTLTLPLSFFHHRYGAEVANRAALADSVSGTVTHNIAAVGLGMISMIVYATVMMYYDVKLTLLALLFAGISVTGLYVSQRLLADTHRRELIEQGKLAGIVNRSLSGLAESTAAGVNDMVYGRMIGQQAAMMSRRQATLRNNTVLQALQHCLTSVALIAVLIQGGYDIIAGVITVGMVVAFQGMMGLLSAPVAQLVSASASLQDLRGNVERMDDVMQHPPDALFKVAPKAEQTQACEGDVEFRNVSYSYARNGTPFINQLSLRIRAGTSVAIVGPSGCGKSTLARLLVGLLHPDSGAIWVGDTSLATLSRARRFSTLAHVDQEIKLLSGSLMDNLTLWDTKVGHKAVLDAVRDTGLSESIGKRPGRFSTPVQERGRNFSGGERQRVEIARALAQDTPILVLDEATSALEPPMERAILQALLARKKTLIFISHRTAPLILFDRIIVMNQGRIVQDGAPKALASQAGHFRTLMDA